MVIAITDLTVDKDYADGQKLTEDNLDQAMLTADGASLGDYINTYVKDNLVQFAIDAWGLNNYTFDNDGAANMTNTLFNKQSVTDYYNGGNINIGIAADAGWVAVDAVNASIAITPEVVGKYRAVFYFTHRATTTATTEGTIDVSFRITDGTDASYGVNSGGYLPATAGNSGAWYHPVFLTYEFNWATTTAKTVTLQKYVRTATDIATNVVAAAAAAGEIYMLVEKI